jgi:hypothetical protein
MDQKEIDARVCFIDTLMANVDNKKLSDKEFRAFVRNSVTLFDPAMSVLRVKVKAIGDCIRHCGDYGRIYFNNLSGSTFCQLGDGDDEEYGHTSAKEIKKAFELAGVEVEIGYEYEPDGEGWEEVSRGIEVSNYVTLDHEPKVGEVVMGEMMRKELELIKEHPCCDTQPDGFKPMTGWAFPLWIAKYVDFGTKEPRTILVKTNEI